MEEGVSTKGMNWPFPHLISMITLAFLSLLKMPAIQLPKAYNFSYVSPGYVWEVLRTAVQIVIRCLLELTLKCDVNLGNVGFGIYPPNLVTLLMVYMASVSVASFYLQLVFGSTSVGFKNGVWSVSRGLYNAVMISIFILYLSSAVAVSVADLILIALISTASGMWYGSNCVDKTDSCLFVVRAVPSGLMLMVVSLVKITLQFMITRHARLLVLLMLCGLFYGLNVYGPERFIDVGYRLSNSSPMIPALWFVLASLASAARSVVVVLFKAKINNVYLVILSFHVISSRPFVLVMSVLLSLLGFILASDTLWDPLCDWAMPSVIYKSGYSSGVVEFRTLNSDAVTDVVMVWITANSVVTAIYDARVFIYRMLMRGYSQRNVALVYKQYSGWRLHAARWFVPDSKFRNVYWITATTGAGKTTADVYSNFRVGDLVAGVGFNVIDVDGCVRDTEDQTSKTLAEARMTAAQGSMVPFLDVWIPIAKRFVEARLLFTLADDKQKRRMKTLVMVHVPEEGLGIGLPLCNFLGHINVNPDEAKVVAGSRAGSISPDVTSAFIMSDNIANSGVPEIDWTDVQQFMSPIVGIKDIPLAVFPDVDPYRVYVRVTATPVSSMLSEQFQVRGSIGPLPLVAIVKNGALLNRFGLTFVAADEFGDIKATILEKSRNRIYYDNVPFKSFSAGSINFKLLKDPKPVCVVYRLEIPSRHGARGIHRPVRMRLDVMSAPSKEAAAALIQQKYGQAMAGQQMPPTVQQQHWQPHNTQWQVQALTDEERQRQRALMAQMTATTLVDRELKNLSGGYGLPTPPLAQFISPAPDAKVKIHGVEWNDDDSIVYSGKNVLPPAIPSRRSSTVPCPLEVCKVVEYDATATPWSHIEALRRYIPAANMVKHVVSLTKHGDAAASRVKHPRQLRGWAIRFDSEQSKIAFLQSLRDDVIGTELVANPFAGNTWKNDMQSESEAVVRRYKSEML